MAKKVLELGREVHQEHLSAETCVTEIAGYGPVAFPVCLLRVTSEL